MRRELSCFGCWPQPVEACVCTARQGYRLTLNHASKRSDALIFCFWWVALGGKALHPHQHGPAGQAGRPIRHGAVRGDAHQARLPPGVRGHMVRARTCLDICLYYLIPVSLHVLNDYRFICPLTLKSSRLRRIRAVPRGPPDLSVWWLL